MAQGVQELAQAGCRASCPCGRGLPARGRLAVAAAQGVRDLLEVLQVDGELLGPLSSELLDLQSLLRRDVYDQLKDHGQPSDLGALLWLLQLWNQGEQVFAHRGNGRQGQETPRHHGNGLGQVVSLGPLGRLGIHAEDRGDGLHTTLCHKAPDLLLRGSQRCNSRRQDLVRAHSQRRRVGLHALERGVRVAEGAGRRHRETVTPLLRPSQLLQHSPAEGRQLSRGLHARCKPQDFRLEGGKLGVQGAVKHVVELHALAEQVEVVGALNGAGLPLLRPLHLQRVLERLDEQVPLLPVPRARLVHASQPEQRELPGAMLLQTFCPGARHLQ
mmetsp:Transcript_2909/g.8998  ORF Transcript_2909/g.8998 Transcript_2909/m.8998 type:complete len:329 (-) Transcript_2909:1454-2440(-)